MALAFRRPRDLFRLAARRLSRHRSVILNVLPEGTTLSGPQLLERIESFSDHLARRGVGAGQRLLISASHPLALVVGLPAAWRRGAVPILCGGSLPRFALEARRRDLAAHWTLRDGEGSGEGSRHPAGIALTLSRNPQRGLGSLALPRGTVLVRTTSGTAGPARGVALSGPQVLADARQILQSVRPPGSARLLGAVPLDHAYGFSTLLTPLLFHARRLVLLEKPLPHLFREALSRFAPLYFPGVPVLFELLLEAGLPRTGRRSLVGCLSAGAPLPATTATRFHRLSGVPIRNLYGTSECGAVTCNRSPGGAGLRGSVGTPLLGVRLMFDPSAAGRPGGGRASRRGRIGVAGPAVALGYVRSGRRPERFDGVFWTSDLGRADRRGRLHLEGRLDSMINVGGLKVWPAEVERVLLDAPGVRAAVALGLPDLRRGQMVAAAIVGGTGLRREQLSAFCSRRLPDHAVPRRLLILRDLPRTDRGKVDTLRLRALLASQTRSRPSAAVPPRR